MARAARKQAEEAEIAVEGADQLNGMSVVELNALIDRALLVRDSKVGAARKEFIERVKAEAEGLGMTLSDLSPRSATAKAKGERKPAVVKYRDQETGATWSGRGKMAKVFDDRLKEGRKLEEFLVPE